MTFAILVEVLNYNICMKNNIFSETIIEVQFYDLDPMNVVWHGNYIRFLEEARCDLLSKIGYTYSDMKDDGYTYPVAKMDLKFIKPAIFAQKLRVVTTLQEYEPSLNIKYQIFDQESGEKIFEAKSMQICFDVKSNTSVYEPPKRFVEKLRDYEEK